MTLPNIIASLELRLADLPHQDYARQMVLDTIAAEVSSNYGGEAVILKHAACVTIAGITATGCDLAGAARNWISAARRTYGI